MTGVGGEPRTQAEFIVDTRKKITSLERQLSRQGAIDLAQRVVAGYGISIDGVGSTGDPMVISSAWPEPLPPLPDPWYWGYTASKTVTAAAATWQDVDAAAQTTLTLARELWVLVVGSAVITGAASSYGMVGVDASGALSLAGEVDQYLGANQYGNTAFGESSANGSKSLTFNKLLRLPVGATTLKMVMRRQSTAGSPVIGYPSMRVIPQYWAS